jgi:hypothetical protein
MEIIIGLLVGLVGGGVGTFLFQQTALKNKSQKIVKDSELEA